MIFCIDWIKLVILLITLIWTEPQTGTESIPELPSTTTSSSPEKPKVVVQQVAQPSVTTEEESQKTNVANGQQPLQSLKEGNDSSANKFILTPDYIQQS